MTEPRTFEGHRAGDAAIGDDGLRVPTAWREVLDVLFDGRRIWSLAPSRHAEGDGDCRMIPWPAVVSPYLDGVTRVTVREHVTGRVLIDREQRFGTGSDRIRVVDPAGRPLAVGKAGLLQPPFDEGGADMAESVLDQVSQVLGVLRDECGLAAFVSFGALLGAVREGKLIGHDNDADVGYVSAYSHPTDVARESFRIERAFHRCGFTYRRFAAGDFKVMVADADGAVRGIDVFAGFLLDDFFYLMPYVRARLPRSAILPLGEVKLEGRWLPAPADPPALLEATYGPEWRIPDPSFKFRPPPETRRRLIGWMRGLKMHRDHWDAFYRGKDSAAVPREPSSFARWVAARAPSPTSIVDIGSGTGRDALWFARSGYDVLGLDYATAAINQTRKTAEEAGLPASFEALDLYDLRQVLAMGARLSADGPKTMYGRFLVHALEDDGRHQLWRLAEMGLRSGGNLYLEFRTGKDAATSHEFGEHFRRLLDPDVVVDEIESRGGHVEYREDGHGLAPFGNEDPHVSRLVVGWSQ